MAETGKKATKAPAKPRAAATTNQETAPKATAKKASAKKAVTTSSAAHTPTHQEIAHLAHQYWAERGHAHGNAEQDWLRAERELSKKSS